MSPFVWFLAGNALKASVVLIAAWAAALALRRASAASRYLVWGGALACLLALPALSLVLPAWQVAAPPARFTTPSEIAATAAGAAPAPAPEPEAAFPWLTALWGLGAAAVLARLLAGFARLAAFRRRAALVDPAHWQALSEQVSAAAGLRRPVTLLESHDVEVPVTCGLGHAAVLLPASAAGWSTERRRAVLLHEFTHVKRRDHLAQVAARMAVALYWFHPLAWLAASRFRREQERSCDDAVLRAGVRGSHYAGHLLALARTARGWPAALGMAEGTHLEARVRAALDPQSKRRAVTRRAAGAAAAAVLIAAAPLAALHAQSSRPTATLFGAVCDPSQARVPDAVVLLKSLDVDRQEIARANPAGEFRFQRIPAGRYNLEVHAPGFALLRRAGLVLAPNAADRLDLTVVVGQVSESVDVVAERPSPPQRNGAPQRIRVGGNVQATRLLTQVKPVYPEAARAAGIEGPVLLRAVISTTGDLLGLSVVNTVDPMLAQAAMDAVRQWHYQPTLLNGQPVEVVTTITVSFRLQ